MKIEVAHKYQTVDTLRQQYMFVPAKYKDCYLAFLLTELVRSNRKTSSVQNTPQSPFPFLSLAFFITPTNYVHYSALSHVQ